MIGYFTSFFLKADRRFLWNGHLLNNIPNSRQVDEYLTPLVHGCKKSIWIVSFIL